MRIVRVGIIGQGRSGRDIHGAYLSTDPERYRISAVVDPLPERRDRACREYGCDAHERFEELLERDDVDLIVNASPSKYHVPITVACLEAGRSVLCEKPMASCVADADRMIAASDRSGSLLAIFQQSRYSPAFRKVREVIDSGVLGDAVQINISYNGFQRRYDWQTLTSEMGGNLLNTGPHPLDQALQFFGAESDPEVACVMRCVTNYGDADDYVLLVLSGKGRPTVRLEISSCCRFVGHTYEVYGSLGGLRGSLTKVEWETYDRDAAPPLALIREPLCQADGTPAYCSDTLTWNRDEWTAPEGMDLFGTMSRSFYDMLYRTITEGAPLEITPRQVRRQISVIEECRRQNPALYG